MEEKKNKRKRYIISMVLSFVISAGVFYYEWSISGAKDLWSISKFICDGCFVSAILYLSMGLMTQIAGGGGMDGVIYGWKVLLTKLNPRSKDGREETNYYDFINARKEKRQGSTYLLIPGGVQMICAVAALIWFQSL